MSTPPLDRKLAQQALDARAKYHTEVETAEVLGIGRGALQGRLRQAKAYGLKPKAVKHKIGRKRNASMRLPPELAQQALDVYTRVGGNTARAAIAIGIPYATLEHRLRTAAINKMTPTVLKEMPQEATLVDLMAVVLGLLKQFPQTAESLSKRLKIDVRVAHAVCAKLYEVGHSVFRNSDGVYSVEKTPAPHSAPDTVREFVSDEKGRYRFGVVSDTHLGSKYCRTDVLDDLYDWFANEGITRVYHAGNWIDGEARFNKYDLVVHGMDAQCRFLAKRYPQRKNIVTYAVAGDDHEGWYNQREGVDIGRYLERTMREAGRDDWYNLGYMEAFVSLRHKGSGKTSQMLVMHPGGGSAYALSYQPQKIVESLAGGEKPAVLLLGHYHKMEAVNVRNTWVLQCGTTKDQDPFMRKKRIEAHVGGTIVELRQDERGAITDFLPWMRRYFTTGYYDGRFSHSGDVVLPAMGR